MRKKKMAKILIMALGLFWSANSFAYSSGSAECLFEIYSKRQPAKAFLTTPFVINLMEAYEDAFKIDLLDNRILFRYTPGLVGPKDVRFFVLDMSYMMANAGAEVPLVPNGIYTIKIGRQDSDLIGAFLVCKTKDLK